MITVHITNTGNYRCYRIAAHNRIISRTRSREVTLSRWVRRAALLVTSQRLEALKAADWDDIALSSPLSYEPYYITHSSGWALNLSETKETITVDNLSDAQMTTEAQYMDDDGMDDSYDYLQITIVVEWNDPTTNRVSLTSLVGPP